MVIAKIILLQCRLLECGHWNYLKLKKCQKRCVLRRESRQLGVDNDFEKGQNICWWNYNYTWQLGIGQLDTTKHSPFYGNKKKLFSVFNEIFLNIFGSNIYLC